MIPVYVTIASSVTHNHAGRHISGNVQGEDVGVTLEYDGQRVILKEPFNNTIVSMALDGLYAVNVVVNPESVHVLGNYSLEKVAYQCCVSHCNTTSCGQSVCISCGSTTVCC